MEIPSRLVSMTQLSIHNGHRGRNEGESNTSENCKKFAVLHQKDPAPLTTEEEKHILEQGHSVARKNVFD